MISIRFIALLCTFSVLFVAGCQKQAQTPPANNPTPPANTQPAPEAPAPTPPTGATAPIAPQPGTGTTTTRPSTTSFNGRVVAIENGLYSIEFIDLGAVFTGENKPLSKAEFDKLSEDEKKAYALKRAELAKSAPKMIKKVQMLPETTYIIPILSNEKDDKGNIVRKMSTGSQSDISTSSYLNVIGELNKDGIYSATRVMIQNPPKNSVPQS